jgi:16S rRNA (cytosine1402-N4)-methyltransferase
MAVFGHAERTVHPGRQPLKPMEPKHDPVMVREILDLFALKPGDSVIDGTLGLAGHSMEFGTRIGPGGRLMGLDWDEAMLGHARSRMSEIRDVELILIHDDFRCMAEHARAIGLKPNAILLDLGLNSAQIADESRGIAFSHEGPLDMRMDRTRGETAAALLNRIGPVELENILFRFGDERWARAIAREVVSRRRERPLRTTTDLVEAVLAAVPPGARDKRIHPATRVYQAIRIAVNRELEELDAALQSAAGLLEEHGVLAVLSYHSGEDRIVKHTFRELASTGAFDDVYRKPLEAGHEEVRRNPRSRSAKLRAIRRTRCS